VFRRTEGRRIAPALSRRPGRRDDCSGELRISSRPTRPASGSAFCGTTMFSPRSRRSPTTPPTHQPIRRRKRRADLKKTVPINAHRFAHKSTNRSRPADPELFDIDACAEQRGDATEPVASAEVLETVRRHGRTADDDDGSGGPEASSFNEFFVRVEPRLRAALTSRYSADRGREGRATTRRWISEVPSKSRVGPRRSSVRPASVPRPASCFHRVY
jgi:hypothetical protein